MAGEFAFAGRAAQAGAPARFANEDATALVLHTSGTTSRPKRCRLLNATCVTRHLISRSPSISARLIGVSALCRCFTFTALSERCCPPSLQGAVSFASATSTPQLFWLAWQISSDLVYSGADDACRGARSRRSRGSHPGRAFAPFHSILFGATAAVDFESARRSFGFRLSKPTA